MNEVTKRMIRDGWSGRCAELKCGDCRVSIDQSTSLLTKTWMPASINWCAIGSVDTDTAEQMVTLMRAAIRLAKRWNSRNGKPVKYPKVKA